MSSKEPVDVCLVLEGTYPYVIGGVSSWAHDLIKKQDHLTFHLISILPRDDKSPIRFELPPNVRGLDTIYMQRFPAHSNYTRAQAKKMFDKLRKPLITLTSGTATLATFREIAEIVRPHRHLISEALVLNSEEAWELMTSMYEASFSETSITQYFWSWRALIGSIFSMLMIELPDAKCYHTLNTGYAGLLCTRAHVEQEKPVIITEHGIYTTERRIEISVSHWLEEDVSKTMTINQTRTDLRSLWIDSFANFSRVAYEAATHIVTLYTGNQQAQIADGAHPVKMKIIPNGIDVERFTALGRKPHPRPTMALIGRVSPIKDIKTFLRVAAMVRRTIPDLRALIIGPLDESPQYVEECKALAEYLELKQTVTFTGAVKIDDYLPEVDVLVLSSISEVQPLVILEAGASGIPAVVTDVGGCSEMVLGKKDEHPPLGPGGIMVPLANANGLATAIIRIFSDKDFYEACSASMRNRVKEYFDKEDQYLSYKLLYKSCM